MFDLVIMFVCLQNANFSQQLVILALRLMNEVAESSPKAGRVEVIMRYLESSIVGDRVSKLPYMELVLSK